MSYQYNTHEYKKEKSIRDSLSLYRGYHFTTINSSPRRF